MDQINLDHADFKLSSANIKPHDTVLFVLSTIDKVYSHVPVIITIHSPKFCGVIFDRSIPAPVTHILSVNL